MSQALPAKPRFFYGYWILAIAFIYLVIFSGCGVGAFSFFVRPLQEEFGWGRGEIMVAFTIYFLLSGFSSPVVGSIIDRYGVKGVVSLGAVVAAAGFISLTQLQGIWHFYLAYTFIGIGLAAFGPIPASALISNWFKKRRGLVIGIMSAGLGVGILVVAQLLSGFIMPAFGWQTGYLVLGVSAVIPLVLTLFFVRTKPEEMGLRQYGDETVPDGRTPIRRVELVSGIDLKTAWRTPALWLMIICYFLGGYSSMGLTQNQVPHLQDIGFPLSEAAIALLGLGIGSAVGKFIFGWLCDRISPKYAYAISLFLLAGGVIFILSLKATSPVAMVWLYAIFNGFGNGGWLPTMSMMVNVNFGLTTYGAILGVVSLAQSVGCAVGPLTAGYLFDRMDTYRWAFLTFLAANIVAMMVILTVRSPMTSPRKDKAAQG